jgi:serine/threonine protein kinase
LGDSGQADVTCQVCGKNWPADHSICPDDGTWLYEQTLIELAPKSKRPSIEIPPPAKGRRHDTAPGGHGARYENTLRHPQRPPSGPMSPLRGASTDMIAAQLAPAEGPVEIQPGTQIGDYMVESKVGEGAMGTVYRAVHPAIGKQVAIKVMTPKVFGEAESVKRFVGEARAVAAIEHQGIVDVFGFGRISDGRTYLVMEWLDGQSLSARMQQGEIPFLDACEIIRQIARALEAAHAKGIIHRDLKPENVFLKRGGGDDDKPNIKLLDFGLAKSTNKEDAANLARTRSGQMLGTPLYMSPEQCKNKSVDHRTDIYALGCMCFELLCGRTPYDADNVAEIITAHLVAEPPRPTKFKPDLPADLDKLLFGMIQKDPDRRPPLGEIRRIVGMHLSRVSGIASPLTPPEAFAHLQSNPFAAPYTPQSNPFGQAYTPQSQSYGQPYVEPGSGLFAPVGAPPSGVYRAAGDPQPYPDAPARNGPPWFFWAAVSILIVVVAVILAVK